MHVHGLFSSILYFSAIKTISHIKHKVSALFIDLVSDWKGTTDGNSKVVISEKYEAWMWMAVYGFDW